MMDPEYRQLFLCPNWYRFYLEEMFYSKKTPAWVTTISVGPSFETAQDFPGGRSSGRLLLILSV